MANARPDGLAATMANGWVTTALVGSLLLLAGCVVSPPAVVQSPPPPPQPQVEIVPVQPGVTYVWVPGHHAWRGPRYGYVWIPGRWVAPASPTYVWVPGRWEPRGGGWVWVEGHWRPR